MMYPVSIWKDSQTGKVFLLSSDGKILAEIYRCPEITPDIVANALNALNEFPKPLHEKPDEITFGYRLFAWYDKYINPRPVKEVK